MSKFLQLIRSILKNEYFWLSIVVALALLARLYKINNPVADWHSWRQADTASVSRIYVQEGIDFLHPRYHDISSVATAYQNPQGWRFVEFPIYNAAHALLFQAYPQFSLELWGRLLSVFSSLGSTILLFLLGRRFLGRLGGVLSSFFFALLPFNIYFSRVILPEPLAVALGLAALWFFVRWIDEKGGVNLFLSGIFFAAGLLVKPFVGFYAVPMLYLAFSKFGKKAFSHPRLWMFGASVLIPFFAWRAWMWIDTFFVGVPHWAWAFNGDGIRFRPSFWRWIFGERLGVLILGVWGLVPFVFGLLKKSRGKFPWFLHSFALGMFLYVSTFATASVRHDYYQTFIVPAVALLLAHGTLVFWNLKGFNRLFVRALLLVSIVFALGFSWVEIREFYKINHPEILRAGEAADRLLPADALVIAPYGGDTAFLYQTKRRGWPYVTLPMQEMIENLGAQYYVSVNFDKQTAEVMERYKLIEKTQEYVIVNLQ